MLKYERHALRAYDSLGPSEGILHSAVPMFGCIRGEICDDPVNDDLDTVSCKIKVYQLSPMESFVQSENQLRPGRSGHIRDTTVVESNA
jgi:hypothetical protein